MLNKGIADNNELCDPVQHQAYVMKSLGVDIKDKRLEFWSNNRQKESVEKFLSRSWTGKDQILIGINAFASSRWRSKAWNPKNYAQLADRLAHDLNARIVFTGTKAEYDEVDEIIQKTHCKPINACGKTSIMELSILIKRCAIFLTIDSAPMHIAAAVGTPFVALFGPTDPKRHLPNAEKFVLIAKDLECSPCYHAQCNRKECMDLITVDEVYGEIINLWKKVKHENIIIWRTLNPSTSFY